MRSGSPRCRVAPALIRAGAGGPAARIFGVRVRGDGRPSRRFCDAGKVEAALALLAKRGLTYEQDGALWFREPPTSATTRTGCSGRATGRSPTSLPDIAYHIDKHERGFHRVIDVWGADHHGYIPRMRAVLKALGYRDDYFEVALVQLVKVVKGGEEVSMSKRSGEFVTLRELLEWVGVDATRYFFLMRPGHSPFTFDVDLARKQTDENPIFYVQMAHARMSGIFRVAGRAPESASGEVAARRAPAPRRTSSCSRNSPCSRIWWPRPPAPGSRTGSPTISKIWPGVAHGWYHKCRVLGEPPATEAARLALARAARIVLAQRAHPARPFGPRPDVMHEPARRG